MDESCAGVGLWNSGPELACCLRRCWLEAELLPVAFWLGVQRRDAASQRRA